MKDGSEVKEKWEVLEADAGAVAEIAEATGLSLLTSRVLCARGLTTADKVRNFLSLNTNCSYDPFLLKDMDRAAERLRRAVERGERVCIYGDYDVDGVTATTILYKYLSEKGVRCSYFIPGRIEDGYGLNKRAIAGLEGKTDLIVTVDTGITAVEETEYAKSLGIDMLITDHHGCREVLPDACAVVDPHREDCPYPFKQLAGVGVVYKLLAALDGGSEGILRRFGDIIAIGTIADVMPIVDENRYITARGIELLQNTANLGLRALIEQSGLYGRGDVKKRISSTGVGFVLAPRINAAGRIRSAKAAVELLLAEDRETARALAAELCTVNKERQDLELEIYEQALVQLRNKGERKVYVLASEGWHQGVIGVVASRITDRFFRPSVLLSFDGDCGKGSGRSVKGFSMLEALHFCSGLLEEYGGHELAAGLGIKRENLEAFDEKINAYAAEKMGASPEAPPLFADAEAEASDVTLKQARELSLLEPFGLQNCNPVLLMRDALIEDASPLSAGKHTRLRLRQGGVQLNAVYFGMNYDEFPYRRGDRCDLMFALEESTYRGVSEAKMFVKRMRFGSFCEREDELQAAYYKAAVSPENCEDLPRFVLPTLPQFRRTFTLLRRETGTGRKSLALRYLQRLLRDDGTGVEISLCALHIILDVLVDSGLADCEFSSAGDVVSVRLLPFKGKVNLDRTPLLVRIKRNHRLY